MLLVVLGGAGVRWWQQRLPAEARAFRAWNTAAQDGRSDAAKLECARPLYPESEQIATSMHRDGITDDIKIGEVIDVLDHPDPQKRVAEVHFVVRGETRRNLSWRDRVNHWISGDDQPWEYNDWYATMSFERGAWKVCDISIEASQ